MITTLLYARGWHKPIGTSKGSCVMSDADHPVWESHPAGLSYLGSPKHQALGDVLAGKECIFSSAQE